MGEDDHLVEVSSGHLELAMELYDAQNLIDARKHFALAYLFDPDQTMEALSKHAGTYAEQEDYEAAIPLLETAFAFDPSAYGDSYGYLVLGLMYAETGKSVEEISELFAKGVESGLDPAQILEHEADVYVNMGELEEAISVYDSLCDNSFNPEYMKRKAMLTVGLNSQPSQILDY